MKELISKQNLFSGIANIAAELNKHFENKEVVLVYIEDGATRFKNMLLNYLDVVEDVQSIKVKSYVDVSSQFFKWIKAPDCNKLKGKSILLLDDIFDTGKTIKNVVDKLKGDCKVKEVFTCVMLNKKKNRNVDFEVDWAAFDIEDKFVIGFGLDYNGKYRDLDGIYIYSGGD